MFDKEAGTLENYLRYFEVEAFKAFKSITLINI